MRAIDHTANRNLRDNARQTPDGEGDADLFRIPSLRCQIDCQKRANPGLDIGEEEIEPVQSAQTALRWMAFHCGALILGEHQN
jgi:hypothetical protein